MKRRAIVAAVVVVLLAACAFIAAPMVGDKALVIDTAHWEGNPLPPCFVDSTRCGGHILGSDENGRDVLARLIAGGRLTIGTALLALFVELAIAFVLTVLVGRGARIIDRVVVSFAEGMSALPRVPFALLIGIAAFSGAPHNFHPGTLPIAVEFGVIFWPAAFFALRSGAMPAGIARRTIGDLMTIVLVSSTIEFFGYGHQPPTPTWGNMLANPESNIEIAWWASVFPGVCIFVTVLLLEIVRRGLPPAKAATGRRQSIMAEPSTA